MTNEVKVPKLGDNVEAAEITAVLVAVGDSVSEGQSLIELESDKASVEVPSPAAGVVQSLAVAEGDSVSEGQLILTLAAGDSAPAAAKADVDAKADTKADAPAEALPAASSAAPDASEAPAAQPAAASTSGTLDVQVPKLGDNVDSAEVIAVLVAAGDDVSEGQSLIELESDKASVEVPSPVAGKVLSVAIAVGDQARPEQVILSLQTSGSAPAAQASGSATSKPAADTPAPAPAPKADPQGVTAPYENQPRPELPAAEPLKPGQLVAAAPSVRRFARELGADIQRVPGSGPRGRISLDDVKRYVKGRLQAPAASSGSAVAQDVPDLPDFSAFGPVSHEKMSPVRRATARQMQLAWSQIPHVTQFDQADITAAEVFRKQHGKPVEKAGGKLTVTAILLKICALALKRFPQFNASIDVKNEQIVFKQHYHIGVAVDTPRGLLVPVLRDVDKKGLIDLSVEMGQLAGKARDRKTGPEDLQGGTFTISNLGGLGTTYFTPVVNWPQVAILGVGRASMQPVWREGSFEPRLIMPLSVSYDHRLIDGADAARFLRWIAEALENPLLLLMEGDL
ncbi:MAG: dihydrolipoyllysine-residue acetyltransferase [Candidatus Sericytochromatia bacterium]|nr:dihydrolipoyllysine-residue acetyltransferase [Candidatus Sericytochromatia bacterium]